MIKRIIGRYNYKIVESYEQTLETMALLKILALGNRQIEEGKLEPAASVIQRLRRNLPIDIPA